MPERTLILLFAAATAVAVGTRLIKLPYTVALVLAGLALGATPLGHEVHLTKDLLYSVFLPGLVFEAAYHLELSALRRNAMAIVALSVPGVVVAMAVTAALLVTTSSVASFESGFGWPHALVFGALIAATDPIAVVALFKTLGAPERLGLLVEGESLVNDGTAIVLFGIVFSVVTGGRVGIAEGAFEFAKVVGMGVVIGGAFGATAARVFRRLDDPMIELTATVIAAYGSFVAAEGLHFSGVIATLTAGVLCGDAGASGRMSLSTRIAVDLFWQYAAFALNSVVFLLIGLEVPIGRLAVAWRPIGLAFLAVTIGRAAVVFASSALLARTRERIPWRWACVLTWGGLRGALSMVLAMALPDSFPHRELIVTMTFGVVLLSIVVQGLTAGPLLRALHLAAADRYDRVDEESVELDAARAVLAVLASLDRKASMEPSVTRALRLEYEARARLLRRATSDREGGSSEERARILGQLLQAERQVVLEAYRSGRIDETSRDRLLVEIDSRAEGAS
jgi:CPA1 family monovalent cation:H+ antiporter